jgi:hypothetical protein
MATNGQQTCTEQMGKVETEGEGRSGSKFQAQRLSECLMKKEMIDGYRFVRAFSQRRADGRLTTYRYFVRYKNKKWPQIRLPGEPGSPEFMAVYERALAATTLKQFKQLREEVNLHIRRHIFTSSGDAIVAWAEGRELSPHEIELIMRALGLTHNEVISRISPAHRQWRRPDAPGPAIGHGPCPGAAAEVSGVRNLLRRRSRRRQD